MSLRCAGLLILQTMPDIPVPEEKNKGQQDYYQEVLRALSKLDNSRNPPAGAIPRQSNIARENPLNSSSLYGYRQLIAQNSTTCRSIGEKINVIQIAKRHLVNKIRPYLHLSTSDQEAGFSIYHIDREHKTTKQEKELIKQLERFFLHCGAYDDTSEDDLRAYTSKLVQDFVDLDMFAGQTLRNIGGKIIGIQSVDTATIVPLLPREKGITGFDFAQMLNGMEHDLFSKDEITLSVGYPHNNLNDLRMPGTPTVMVAFELLYSHIAAENHNAARFKLDNLPRGMFLVNGLKSPQDMAQIQDWFVGAMNNNPMYTNQWRIPMIPMYGENGKLEWISFQEKNRDMEFSQLYEIGMSIIAAMFQIDLTELGIHSAHSTQMVNNQQLGRFREAGSRSLTSILTFIEGHFNQVLRKIAPDYVFAFTGKDIKNNEQQNNDEKHRLNTTTSVNALRSEKDQEAVGPGQSPVWDYPNTEGSRAAIDPLSKILPLNVLAASFGHEGYDAHWATDVPAAWAQTAWQQEQQEQMRQDLPEGAEGQENGEEADRQEQQGQEEGQIEELPDVSEIEKSQKARKAQPHEAELEWPYRQLQITSEDWAARQQAITDKIMRTLEHALSLPGPGILESTEKSQDPLIWRGRIVFDPETGQTINRGDFDKLLDALKKYAARNNVSPEELILTPEIIGRIIGRAYSNGDDYEKLIDLEFSKDRVSYRGHDFMELLQHVRNLSCLRKMLDLNDRDVARIEYARDNAAYLLQRASDELIQEVRRIVTAATIKKLSKRDTARELRERLGAYNRDFLKIANTELNDAHCNAVVSELAANTPEGQPVLLERMEMHDMAVCEVCRRFNGTVAMLVEGERDDDTAPEDSPASVLIWAGKTNYRRKRAEWWLPIGTVHPCCRGNWRPYKEKSKYAQELFERNNRENKIKVKLWKEAQEEAFAPVWITMPDGTKQKRKGKGNLGSVYARKLREAQAKGLIRDAV